MEEIEKNWLELEKKLNKETDAVRNRLWTSFQKTAAAVAKVYMSGRKPDSDSDDSVAADASIRSDQFGSAAQSTTKLYKDSLEGLTSLSELWEEKGSINLTRDLLNFIGKRKGLRKDELMTFLQTRKPSPPEKIRSDDFDMNEKFTQLFKPNSSSSRKRKRNNSNEFKNNDSNKKSKLNE